MVVKNQKLSPAALYAGLKQKSQTFVQNFRNVCAAAKKQGFSGIAKLFWQDLFGGRSLAQWLYLIALSSLPFILEFTSGQEAGTLCFLDRHCLRHSSSRGAG